MSSLTERTPSSKVPRKRLFKEDTYGSPSIAKFKRSSTSSFRNFPVLCCPFSAKDECKSIDFLDASISVTPLSVVPNLVNHGGIDGTKEKAQKFNSTMALMKVDWDLLLGDSSCSEREDDGMFNAEKLPYEAVKIPKDHKICHTCTKFGSDFETKPSKNSMEYNCKSVGDDEDDSDHDNDCVIVDEKSSNIFNVKAVDKNHLKSIITENSSLSDQVQMSKRWEFDWFEEVHDEDDDEISFLSPSEWQNLIHNHSEREAEPSNKCGVENVAKARKQEMESTKELKNMSIAAYDEAGYDEATDVGVGSHNKVREILNLYHELCTKLSLEDAQELNGRRSKRLAHVQAAMVLKKENKWLNIERTIGYVPGVEIGDQFQFRAELVVVGLHHEFISGINCMTMGETVYAISVVDSGKYENKIKSSNVLVYSGQGGNPKAQAKHLEDQKLERGNLGLKNSMHAKFPVRVIRKIQVEVNKQMYIYDGLYNVVKFWPKRSETGKMAYMFEMVRVSGQSDCNHHLTMSEPRSSIRYPEARRAIMISDVSRGKEKFQVTVVNEISNEKPGPFTYITGMIISTSCSLKRPVASGCGCIGGCSDLHPCVCVKKNRREIPFNEDGAILRVKKIIYECGPNCKCPPSCQNKVSQHGPKIPLEVFKTKSTGWGVRSREEIQSGSFICEYLGELVEDKDADRRSNDEYLFDLDDGEGFTIDAAKYGNVSRFINHSCSPNLYVQDILFDHEDKKLPHVMLFATKNIRPLEELTYDYNYKIDRVCDANGNIKKKKCYCGARSCTGRLY